MLLSEVSPITIRLIPNVHKVSFSRQDKVLTMLRSLVSIDLFFLEVNGYHIVKVIR